MATMKQKQIKYYIYHIEGVKIGCTSNPKRRFESKGYKNAVIIEEYNDIDVASKREIELQEYYGYSKDKSTYKETIEFIKKAYTKTKRPIAKEKHIETIEERTIRLYNWHKLMKEKGVGFYNKENSMKAGLVSKDKFSIPVIVYEYPSMKYVNEFTSAKAAGKELGITNIGNIRNILKGRGKSLYGYTFKYK
jgi:hypothetical protein